MRIFAAIIFGALLGAAARAEDLPDQRPMLRIEPGMHTGVVKRIGVDAACTRMVTGSDDKTARLWALPEGGHGSPELLRTLRVPIGEGNDGMLFAVALSPDGKWVAAGGWERDDGKKGHSSIYIFESATGRLAARLGRLPTVTMHLVYSPDGSRLAAMLGEGMRLWETGSWRLLAEDTIGEKGYGAAFDNSGHLFTVTDDGQIRRYDAEGRLQGKAKTVGGKEPSWHRHPPNRHEAGDRLQRHDGCGGLRCAHVEAAFRRPDKRNQGARSVQGRLVHRRQTALCWRF